MSRSSASHSGSDSVNLSQQMLAIVPAKYISVATILHLNLDSNRLTQFPSDLKCLPVLQTLTLRWNSLTELPSSIGSCHHLVTLDCGFNQIHRISDTISNCRSLRTLLLNDNSLTHLPDSVGDLKQLQELNVDFNQLSNLPSSIATLFSSHGCIKSLQCRGNPLTVPPPDIAYEGFAALKSYYEKQTLPASNASSPAKATVLDKSPVRTSTLPPISSQISPSNVFNSGARRMLSSIFSPTRSIPPQFPLHGESMTIIAAARPQLPSISSPVAKPAVNPPPPRVTDTSTLDAEIARQLDIELNGPRTSNTVSPTVTSHTNTTRELPDRFQVRHPLNVTSTRSLLSPTGNRINTQVSTTRSSVPTSFNSTASRSVAAQPATAPQHNLAIQSEQDPLTDAELLEVQSMLMRSGHHLASAAVAEISHRSNASTMPSRSSAVNSVASRLPASTEVLRDSLSYLTEQQQSSLLRHFQESVASAASTSLDRFVSPASSPTQSSIKQSQSEASKPSQLPDFAVDDSALPEHFRCPITTDRMLDPVVAADGHTYERAAIEQWLAKSAKSPMTGSVLGSRILTPNFTLRSMIAEWMQQHRK